MKDDFRKGLAKYIVKRHLAMGQGDVERWYRAVWHFTYFTHDHLPLRKGDSKHEAELGQFIYEREHLFDRGLLPYWERDEIRKIRFKRKYDLERVNETPEEKAEREQWLEQIRNRKPDEGKSRMTPKP